MTSSLRQAVQGIIDAGRIGTPVAVRVVAHEFAAASSLDTRLAGLLEESCHWLKTEFEQIAALGSEESGQMSLLARCRGGQTVLATTGTFGAGLPLFELSVVGTRGVIHWRGDANTAARQHITDEWHFLDDSALKAIRRALSRTAASTSAGASPAASRTAARQAKQVPAGPMPWGVLLIGGSHTHQENYAAAFAADRRCRLVGLSDAADISPRRAALNQRLAQELKIPLLPDLAAALQSDDVHIVSVCAEPERRAAIILQAAAAGKHLYLDKPLAASRQEGRDIAAAVQQAGVRSHMFNLAHSPASLRARRLAESGTLGELRAVHCDLFFAKGHGGEATLAGPRRESDCPANFETIDAKREFYNVGVYPAVWLRGLLQRPVKQVHATTGNYFFAEHQRQDMEDFGAALIEYEGGTVATIMAGRTGWRSHPASGLQRTCLVGSRQVEAVDAFLPRLEIWADEEPWTAPRRHPDDPMGFWSSTQAESGVRPKLGWVLPGPAGPFDAAYFLDCLEQGREGEASATAAADVLNLLLDCYASAARPL
ncbi:MAG: Gfo/Idh/MocA family protein [Pirellulales bacterium]